MGGGEITLFVPAEKQSFVENVMFTAMQHTADSLVISWNNYFKLFLFLDIGIPGTC